MRRKGLKILKYILRLILKKESEDVGNKPCEEIKPDGKNPVSDINCTSIPEKNLASDVKVADSVKEEDEEGIII